MFEAMPTIWKQIFDVLMVVAAMVAAASYAFANWRNGTTKASTEAVTAYKMELEAVNMRMARIEDENKDLHKTINQLIGENRVLKETLNLRDPDFMKEMSEGFASMKEMLHCLNAHDLQAKDIQKDVTIIRQDLDKIEDFCDNTIKPFISKG